MADGTAAAPPYGELAAAFEHGLAGRPTRRQPLFTALSGGPDSSALALLAASFASRHGHRHTALIIDHGIRPDSAAEAARVRDRMLERGIVAEILKVGATAPATGLQAWARAMRYDLLLERAHREGGCLLLGHHAGDQAETVMMRLGRGSGLAGLGGMRSHAVRAGVDVLRPLLGVDSAHLAACCREHGLATETDPSNEDRRFERVRVRGELADMARDGTALPERLGRLASAAAAIDDRLLALLARDGLLPAPAPSGHMAVPSGILDLPDLVRNRALAHIVRQIGAAEHVPSGRALARLGARLAAGQAATVGGAKFSPEDGGWLVTAEPGRRPPRLHMAAGSRAVFNHVWEIESPVEATVRHLGEAGSGANREWDETPGWCALPPLVRRALPVLETLDGSVVYPHLIEMWPECAVRPSAAMRFLAVAPRTSQPKGHRRRR